MMQESLNILRVVITIDKKWKYKVQRKWDVRVHAFIVSDLLAGRVMYNADIP